MSTKYVEVRPDWRQLGLLSLIALIMIAAVYYAFITGRNQCVDRYYISPETGDLVNICVMEEVE